MNTRWDFSSIYLANFISRLILRLCSSSHRISRYLSHLFVNFPLILRSWNTYTYNDSLKYSTQTKFLLLVTMRNVGLPLRVDHTEFFISEILKLIRTQHSTIFLQSKFQHSVFIKSSTKLRLKLKFKSLPPIFLNTNLRLLRSLINRFNLLNIFIDINIYICINRFW